MNKEKRLNRSPRPERGGRLREKLEREKEKILALPEKKRLSYIWQYYWLWIVGILCGVFLFVYIVYHACFTARDYWFYAVFANTTEDAGNGSLLWQDFVEYSGYDTRQKRVQLDAASYFDPSKPGGTANSYFQAFVAVTESGVLDALVMEEEGLAAVGQSGRLLDLNREECASLRERYADRLIYCEPYDEDYAGELVPVGIDISDSLLATRYHVYEDGCALGIGAYTQRLEAVELFLQFILGEEE